jgi:hypothetical protein
MTFPKPPARKVRGFFFDNSAKTRYIDNMDTIITRTKWFPWFGCLLALVPWSLSADIYKQVQPDGTVSYSSDPSPNAEKIEPPPLQVIPEAEPLTDTLGEDQTPTDLASYTQISIVEPANDQVIYSNERIVSVDIEIEPVLQTQLGHSLVILLDGIPVEAPTNEPRVTLNEVDRGTHTLTAEIRDADGHELIQSAPVTFHLMQHSSLNPPRAAPK